VRLVGKPNNSSMIQPAEAKNWCLRAAERTIVRLRARSDGRTREQAGPQSEQSQKSATFLRRPACWAGHPERTIIRFPTSWAKNEQKKPGLEALAFSEQSPFLCD
jgi:hypothetical protein